MNPYSYSDLTQEEKELFGNEAGSGWTEKIVPEWIYTCFGQHDFYYALGGDLQDKTRADLYLFGYMVLDAAKQKFIVLMLWYILIALIYLIGLTIFGLFFFPFGRKLTSKQAVEKVRIEKGV